MSYTNVCCRSRDKMGSIGVSDYQIIHALWPVFGLHYVTPNGSDRPGLLQIDLRIFCQLGIPITYLWHVRLF